MTASFIIVSGILFLFLAVIWSKAGYANIFFKMAFFVMFVWSVFQLIELKYGALVLENGMKIIG